MLRMVFGMRTFTFESINYIMPKRSPDQQPLEAWIIRVRRLPLCLKSFPNAQPLVHGLKTMMPEQLNNQ